MSKQKDAILNIVQSSPVHMTAEEIFLECKRQNVRVSIATVYRNLGILVSENKIGKISLPGQSDRYDRILTSHFHAICDRCNQLEDIELPDLTEFFEKQTGYRVISYDVCVHHVCAACRKKEALHIF